MTEQPIRSGNLPLQLGFKHRVLHWYLRAYGLLNPRRTTVVACGPHPIHPHFLVWKVGRLLKLRLEPPERAEGARLACWFEFTTNPPVRRTPDDYFGELPALNARCADLSKRRVMRIFEEVFGYGYEVDPLTHEGPLISKTDANGKHNAEIITGPIAADDVDPDRVYQRLLECHVGEEVEDLRICVVGDELPFVLAKRRPLKIRFSNHYSSANPVPEALSEEERAKLIEFNSRFGLDFGELDVIRDDGDGRIYVLDANNTPFSPPLIQPNSMAIRCMRAAADAFERQFLAAERD